MLFPKQKNHIFIRFVMAPEKALESLNFLFFYKNIFYKKTLEHKKICYKTNLWQKQWQTKIYTKKTFWQIFFGDNKIVWLTKLCDKKMHDKRNL